MLYAFLMRIIHISIIPLTVELGPACVAGSGGCGESRCGAAATGTEMLSFGFAGQFLPRWCTLGAILFVQLFPQQIKLCTDSLLATLLLIVFSELPRQNFCLCCVSPCADLTTSPQSPHLKLSFKKLPSSAEQLALCLVSPAAVLHCFPHPGHCKGTFNKVVLLLLLFIVELLFNKLLLVFLSVELLIPVLLWRGTRRSS